MNIKDYLGENYEEHYSEDVIRFIRARKLANFAFFILPVVTISPKRRKCENGPFLGLKFENYETDKLDKPEKE